ncbi:MAG TPA: flagellar motor protein MotB [Terriglobales bacterium]|nr:flagellar motor protein MotB [Terriglobales bacterium]
MPTPPIIIKKKIIHGGHHGGAWKVAYADFVTAMMALFIVLWLLNASKPVKEAVAGYFNDPSGTAAKLGTNQVGTGDNVSTKKDDMAELKKILEKKIQSMLDLEKLNKNIEMTITAEGLRIELLESDKGTFFDSGSPKLKPNGQELLSMLAGQLGAVPNRLSIEGHTDAKPYSSKGGYSNWELSTDRANAARRLMDQAGLRPDQVAQVRGFADHRLRNPKNPLDSMNRRISIIVQYLAGDGPPENADANEGETGHGESQKGKKTDAGKPAAEKPAETKH